MLSSQNSSSRLPTHGGEARAPKEAPKFVEVWVRVYRSAWAAWALRILALVTFLFFLATAVRPGWRRLESDFPNYYTAGVLVRKHQPLRRFYDWTWFQRQMNYAGVERQLGAYAPQTPLTMLPMVALAELPAQRAKQVWLLCNLVFLAATIWMLSEVTRSRIEQVWLLAFCAYFSLRTNFLLGQYYVFLLFLLSLAYYLLHRGRPLDSGLISGLVFALKLYGGPFLLYFLATRKWKAAAGMVAAMAGAGALAIALFGWPDIRYYLLQVLPRSLEGGAIDPYNLGDPTFATLLRRWFLSEPQLNPHPLKNAPWLFFFLRTFINVAIIAFTCLGVMMKPRCDRRDFAWFLVAVLLLSGNVASYTFVLVVAPVVLLLPECRPWQAACLVACEILLTMPPRAAWLFPKLWVLLALFLALGWQYWRQLSPKRMAGAAVIALVLAFLHAGQQMRAYADEPARRFHQITAGGESLFSSSPAIVPAGLFFQTLGRDRYVVRWLHGGQSEEISLTGQALRPMALPDGTISIELVRGGISKMVRFDPATKQVTTLAVPAPMKDVESALSPDGNWLAFTSESSGAKQLWLQNVATGRQTLLAGGRCNSMWPAWLLDSRSIVFASDCGRGFGLPALYQAPIAKQRE